MLSRRQDDHQALRLYAAATVVKAVVVAKEPLSFEEIRIAAGVTNPYQAMRVRLVIVGLVRGGTLAEVGDVKSGITYSLSPNEQREAWEHLLAIVPGQPKSERDERRKARQLYDELKIARCVASAGCPISAFGVERQTGIPLRKASRFFSLLRSTGIFKRGLAWDSRSDSLTRLLVCGHVAPEQLIRCLDAIGS